MHHLAMNRMVPIIGFALALFLASLDQTFAQSINPASQPPSSGVASGQFNVNAQNLIHWRKALGTIRSGTGRGKLLLLGDSTTAGGGAGTGGIGLLGAFGTNWPRSLVSLFNLAFTSASDGSFYGDQNVGNQSIAYNTYDARVGMGANWTNIATTLSLAGDMFKFSVGAVNNLSFTPAGVVDTVIVRYAVNAGLGSFTTNVDGGASLGTSVTGGTQAITSVTYSVARAAHTINIVPDNLAGIFILGITAYDSTVPAIDVMQVAWWGSVTANYVTTGSAWSPMLALASLAPDLTVICLTVNDSNNGVALATYQANMQTIITAAKLTGDVLLVTGPPSNTAAATNGTLDQFVAVEKTLALTNNIGLIDLKTRWVSMANTNPVMPYFDNVHPGQVGYRDMAEAVFSVIGVP
jgi:lysophospholipase L1-like esterase